MHPIPSFKTILLAFITFARCASASASNECPANQEISCESLRSSSGYTYTVPPGIPCAGNCEQGWYFQNGTFIVDSTPNASGGRLPIVVHVTPQNLTIRVCENLQWQLDCKCKCLINYTATDLKHSAARDPFPKNNTSGEEHDGNHKGNVKGNSLAFKSLMLFLP
ncbi:hypothetical protein G5714_016169 [Onychostoma macrolepis]|uniref:Uncharacterized protein n=1 Tax=Onychostoma macrolepis TaxID=369639 RepID=A0A7J6C7Y3_9TELE|nr:hypothetical protein G5714_016169 [Onychostoma macrolepis]